MRLNFFLKCSKLNGLFRNVVEKRGKIFSLLDNWVWIGWFEVKLLSREYFSSGVNVLTNGLKILDTTKTDIFELKFSQSDGKIR